MLFQSFDLATCHPRREFPLLAGTAAAEKRDCWIDDSDVNVSTSQSSGGEQATEATAHDHDAMLGSRRLAISEAGCDM